MMRRNSRQTVDLDLPEVKDELLEVVVRLGCACACGLLVGAGSGGNDE